MTRVMKGSGKKGGKPKLVCTAAKSGARDLDGSQFCTYTSVPLDIVEESLTRNADVFVRAVPARDPNLQQEIDDLDRIWFESSRDLESLISVLAKEPSAAIERRVRKLESECDEMRAEMEVLRERASQSESKLVANRAKRLSKALSAKPIDKAAANAALRECFREVVVDYVGGDLRCKWRHTDQNLTLVFDPGFSPVPA